MLPSLLSLSALSLQESVPVGLSRRPDIPPWPNQVGPGRSLTAPASHQCPVLVPPGKLVCAGTLQVPRRWRQSAEEGPGGLPLLRARARLRFCCCDRVLPSNGSLTVKARNVLLITGAPCSIRLGSGPLFVPQPLTSLCGEWGTEFHTRSDIVRVLPMLGFPIITKISMSWTGSWQRT